MFKRFRFLIGRCGAKLRLPRIGRRHFALLQDIRSSDVIQRPQQLVSGSSSFRAVNADRPCRVSIGLEMRSRYPRPFKPRRPRSSVFRSGAYGESAIRMRALRGNERPMQPEVGRVRL